MFFKKSPKEPMALKPIVSTQASSKLVERPMSEIVQEIHETFFSEVDRILAEASISVNPSINNGLIEKSKHLASLGFEQAKPTVEGVSELTKANQAEAENALKKVTTEAVMYFSAKYPRYRFITKESIQKICSKYGLIYGDVDRYKGGIPDKNVQEMVNFKIDDSDKAYQKNDLSNMWNITTSQASYEQFLDYQESVSSRDFFKVIGSNVKPCPLQIAAPVSDFDTKNMEITNFNLSPTIKDPVVFQPVFFKNHVFYLIMTAWGIEASDESVVNANHN